MSVLQRKAQVGKQEHQARAMTVPKSLRVGLAKLADTSFDMALAVIGFTQDKLPADQIASQVSENGLMLLLDGPAGAVSGAVLDAALVKALVQQQTMGRVGQLDGVERRMTATDAALCAPLIDGLFERAHAMLDMPEDRALLMRYKFGSQAENARLFTLALEAPEYSVLRMTIDVAGGKAQSTLTLILPAAEPQALLRSVAGEADEPVAQPVTMEKTVMGLKADLSAVLCRIPLPLAQVSSLRVGQALMVPSSAFDGVDLTTTDGRVVAKGVMGQIEGKRAIMLETDDSTASAESSEPQAEASDYSKLHLPALELPDSDAPIDPSNLDSLPELPDPTALPDVEAPVQVDEDISTAMEFPDLPDLDEFPDLDVIPDSMADSVPAYPDGEDEDLPDLGDLPKITLE
ncbi:MAG: FliM/FliN family flagellar motor switch protein [Pseudomonadota bacterium]